MSQRKRLTWGDEAKRASAHPATPDEGPASPAYQPDPDANKYENGDTSSWAEDPHPGPYPNSAHPATPDEGPASPAYKAAALERKAHTCIRIATAIMGDPNGDPNKVAAIENHALTLMDLPDDAIKASLERYGMEEEMEEEESKKKASDRIASEVNDLRTRVARLERILVRLAAAEEEDTRVARLERILVRLAAEEEEEEEVEESKKKAMMTPEDAALEAMLKEEGMMTPEDAALEAMLKEEGMWDEGMSEEPMAVEEEVVSEEPMFDAMGMGGMAMDDQESMILAKLFNKNASDDEDEDDMGGDDTDEVEEEVEEEEVEEAKKKASAKPQPKKASTGARKLGGPVSKEAGSDVDELSKIWESAPDVSAAFK
jgi:hypothetical protein